MKRSLLLAVVLTWLAPLTVRAELYQVISINVWSATEFRLGRRAYAMSELTDVVIHESKGTSRLRAKIYIPIGMDHAILRDVMARCRKGGVTSFFIQYKS